MLGVAILASFLLGHLNRALPALSRSRAITCDLLLLATANLDGLSLPPASLAGRDREVPVLAEASGPPGLLIERLGRIVHQFACDPAPIVFRSVLPAFLPDMGRSRLLVERLGGLLDRLRCNHRLVGFDSALSAFALELDRPG
jgi:hypothetical protein